MRREWAKIGGIARGEAGIGSDGDGCDHAVCEQTAPAASNVEEFRGECGMRPVERLGFAESLGRLLHDQRRDRTAEKLCPSDR